MHKAGRLLKAAPEQLRHASPFEMTVEALAGPVELPWTMMSLTTHGKRQVFQDISKEVPSDEEWADGKTLSGKRGIVEEPLRRMRQKGRGEERLAKRTATEAKLPEERGGCREGGASSSRGEDLESFYAVQENCMAVEVACEMPDSRRGWKRFLNNPEAYISSMMRRKQVEVQEKSLKKEDLLKFQEAKGTEVRNFISAECFELAKDLKIDEKKIVGMRWLLTWKFDEKYPDGKKAKARAIVLGYQDPRYPERPTSAPTPSRAGRQLFFQYCSWKKLRVAKGDVSGAFLQGEELDEIILCRPVKEIAEHFGVDENTPLRMKKAAYGLVQAPLHWYQSISNFLEGQGYRKLDVEPCCWIWVDKENQVRGIIHAHVDDFMFGGREDCEIHQALMQNLQEAFKWGTWESQEFVQCGINVVQKPDYSFELSQSKYIEEIPEIRISRDRSRQTEQSTSASREVSDARSPGLLVLANRSNVLCLCRRRQYLVDTSGNQYGG